MTRRPAFRLRWLTIACLLVGGFTPGSPLLGDEGVAGEDDFRVENKVYADDEREPQSRSTTIFRDGIVYDFLAEPAEVTVFDAQRGRFVLLDLTRRIKAELTAQRVSDFIDRLKEWTQSQDDPLLKFLGEPAFEEAFDQSTGELTLSGPWVTYRVLSVEAPSESILKQYRVFSDAYARLNTVLNPGARPPFARLLVNSALAEHKRFPRQVELTVRERDGLLPRRYTLRSEHVLVPQLVESDRRRVAQADQFMAMYAAVDFREYQRRMAQ